MKQPGKSPTLIFIVSHLANLLQKAKVDLFFFFFLHSKFQFNWHDSAHFRKKKKNQVPSLFQYIWKGRETTAPTHNSNVFLFFFSNFWLRNWIFKKDKSKNIWKCKEREDKAGVTNHLEFEMLIKGPPVWDTLVKSEMLSNKLYECCYIPPCIIKEYSFIGRHWSSSWFLSSHRKSHCSITLVSYF